MKQIELKEKRKPREKHFLQENGTIVAKIYNEDVHYLKNGKYEEINNTLIKNGDNYVIKGNSFITSFFKAESKFMEYSIGDYSISMGIKNCNRVNPLIINTDSKLYSEVVYENIFDNIDLKYKIASNKMKEEIVLKNEQALDNEIVFVINTEQKLELVDENKIIILNNENKKIASFEIPFTVDLYNKIEYNVEYELEKEDKCYILKLLFDKAWLNDTSKFFPIIIDPTISYDVNENNVYDTYIFQGDTNIDRSSQSIIKVGVEEYNNQFISNRALLKFNLPSISSSEQIIDATLDLMDFPVINDNIHPKRINIYRITENWDESSANWNNMNDKYDDTRIEACFLSNTSDLETGDFTSIKITDLVKKWYTGTDNYGIMLKLNEEKYDPNYVPTFFSINSSIQDYNVQPLLSITYKNMSGLEDYIKTLSQSISFGSIYENLYNGNLTTVYDIGSTIESKLSIDLNLVYNTSDVISNKDYGLGVGYKLNWYQTINQEQIGEDIYLKYIDEDSTYHYLKQNENEYLDEDGLGLSVVFYNNKYIMTDKEGNQSIFDLNNGIGYLSQYKNLSGNTICVYYDNEQRIVQLVDSDNFEINITYSDNCIIISSPDRTVYLNYSNTKLVNINRVTGVTNISYYENGLIDSVIDENGIQYTFSYYLQNPYRIRMIQEHGTNSSLGNSLEFIYGFNNTKYIDENGKANIVSFNSNGNAISEIVLKDGYSIKGAFGISEKVGTAASNKNKLLSSEEAYNHVNNYMFNGFFSKNNIYFNSINSDVSITNETSYSGNNCLKIVSTNSNQETCYLAHIPNNNYYTFSCYIKNTNDIKLVLSYYTDNNEEVSVESSIIKPKNSFEREDITIFYPEYVQEYTGLTIKIISLTAGTIYIDNVQLEEGEVSNNFNYIENSNFYYGLGDWTTSVAEFYYDGEEEEIIDDSDIFEIAEIEPGLKALQINMNPKLETGLEQELEISGRTGESYTISFWYKNTGIESITDDNCTVSLTFLNSLLNQEVQGSLKQLNPHCDEWQFFEDNFIALNDFDSIKIRFNQEMNANKLYITNIGVYKNFKVVNYTYDEDGNIISLKELNDGLNSFSYGKNNQLLKMTNPRGKHFTFEYDEIIPNKLVNEISATGVSNSINYNQDGKPINYIISNKKNNTNLENNYYRIRLSGTKKYLKNINNEIVVLDEDNNHNVWDIVLCDSYYRIKHHIISDKYMSYNDGIIELNDLSQSSLFEFTKRDNGSYLIKIKDTSKYLKHENGKLISADYVSNDNCYEFYFEDCSYKYFIENDSEYGEDGRFEVKTCDTNLNETIYDTDQVTGLIKSITNSNGNTIYYYFNEKQELVRIKSDKQLIIFEYSNNKICKISCGNKEYNIIYDEFYNVKTIKLNNDVPLITINYENNNGNIESVSYANNSSVNYVYDELEHLIALIKMNNTYYYKYDQNGNLSKIISTDGIEKFLYDNSMRLQKYQCNNFAINYEYDENDNIVYEKYSIDNNDCSQTNQYNNDDALTKVIFDSQTIDYQYDYLGRLCNKSFNNLFFCNYDYVNNGYRTSDLRRSISFNDEIYYYKYDKLDNIRNVYNNRQLLYEYNYDKNNQLIKEKDYSLNNLIRYDYDNFGNIRSKKIMDLVDYKLLSIDRYEYDTNWNDLLIKYNDTNILYDNMGNPTNIGANCLTWTNGKELIGFNNDSTNISYKYNYDGSRIKKIINGREINYYYDNKYLVLETDGLHMIYYIRGINGELEAIKYDNDYYYYIKNAQNDIIGLLDSNNNLVAKYNYDSWGNIISIKDSQNNSIDNQSHIANINPYRYKSYYYDNETGFYYLNSRYYNPTWGRFINADDPSIVLDDDDDLLKYNLFAYCNNNPINMEDEDGEQALVLGGGAIASELLAYAIIIFGSYYILKQMIKIYGAAYVNIYYSTSVKKKKNRQKNKNKSKNNDVDPYKRPGQKKQNRDFKHKNRQRKDWKGKSKHKHETKHTPGRDHRKYKPNNSKGSKKR